MVESRCWDYPISIDVLLSKTDVVYLDLIRPLHPVCDIHKDLCMYIPHNENKEYIRVEISFDGVFYSSTCHPKDKDPNNLGENIVKVSVNDANELFDQLIKTKLEARKADTLLTKHYEDFLITDRILVTRL